MNLIEIISNRKYCYILFVLLCLIVMFAGIFFSVLLVTVYAAFG
jgi:hypothetical protein